MKRIYGMSMLAALFALAAAAQGAAAQKELDETLAKLKRVTILRTEGGVMSNVKNAPYRADQVTETTQTLGDGTRIHNEHRVTVYRDSQGRVRREMPEEVSIWDPNGGVSYALNTKDLTVRKMQVSVSANSGSAGGLFYFRAQTTTGGATTNVGGSRPEEIKVLTQTMIDGPMTVTLNAKTATTTPNKESLGTQTMEGVSAQGERQTRTIEAGAIGNDRPIQIVFEHWYSPDLQMDVMTRHDDPRTGEEITRLININRAEPDPSLFQVPAGYQLIENPVGIGGRGGRGGQ